MENTQTNHQLLAIRLRWLNWLSKPIVAIWNFIVELMSYVWSIITLAWAGMKESINYRYWIIGTIGGSTSVFLFLLFFFIGIQVGEPTLFSIGAVLSILPIAWTYAEIANLIQYKKQNGNDIELKSMKSALCFTKNDFWCVCLAGPNIREPPVFLDRIAISEIIIKIIYFYFQK